LKFLGLIFAMFIILACSALGIGPSEENAPVDEPTSSETGGGDEAVVEEATATSESSLCVNEYYPVSDGATWSYNGTSSETDDFTFTNTITSVRDDGFTVTVEYDNVTLVQEWACTPDGILALDSGGGTAGTLTTSDVNLEMETQNASGITYPKEILPGDTWNHLLDYTGTMDFGGETADVNGNTEYNYTAIGIESVTTSAGIFDAIKVDIVTTININVTVQGTEVPVTFTSTSTSWFGEGIGWIKTDSESDLFGVTSNEAIELVSYNIP